MKERMKWYWDRGTEFANFIDPDNLFYPEKMSHCEWGIVSNFLMFCLLKEIVCCQNYLLQKISTFE